MKIYKNVFSIAFLNLILSLSYVAIGTFSILESFLSKSGYGQITDLNLILKMQAIRFSSIPYFRSPTLTIQPAETLTLNFYNTAMTIPQSSNVKCLQRQLVHQDSQNHRFRDLKCKTTSQNSFKFPITAFSEKIIHLKLTNFKNSVNTSLASQRLSIFLTMEYQSGKRITGSISSLNFRLTPFSLQSYNVNYTSNNHGNIQITFNTLQEIVSTSKIQVSFNQMQGRPSANLVNRVLLNRADKTAQFTFTVNQSQRLISLQRSSSIPSGSRLTIQLNQQNLHRKSPLQYNLQLCVVKQSSSKKCHQTLKWQSFDSSIILQNPLTKKSQNKIILKLSSIRISSSQIHLKIQNNPGLRYQNVSCDGPNFSCENDKSNGTIKIQAKKALIQNNHLITINVSGSGSNSIIISPTNLLPKFQLQIKQGQILRYEKQYFDGVILAHGLEQRYCGDRCQKCMDEPDVCQQCYPQKLSQYPFFVKDKFTCSDSCGSLNVQGEVIRSFSKNCPSCDIEICSNCLIQNSKSYCFRCSGAQHFLLGGSCIRGCSSNSLGEAASNCLSTSSICNVANCQKCQQYSIQNCGKCNSGYFLFGKGRCITQKQCPAGFYINSAQRSCLPCQTICSTCKGRSDFCTGCSQLFIRSTLDQASGKCIGQNYAVDLWYSDGVSNSNLNNHAKYTTLSNFFKMSKFDRLWQATRVKDFLQEFVEQQSQELKQIEAFTYLEMQYYGIRATSGVLYSQWVGKFNRIFQLTLNHYLRNVFLNLNFKTYYFNLLKNIYEFDNVVTLLQEDNRQDTKDGIYTSIKLIKNGTTISIPNTSKPSALNIPGSFNTLEVSTTSSQFIPVLSRIVHLKRSDILEVGDNNNQIYASYAISVKTQSSPLNVTAKFIITKQLSDQQRSNLRCVGLDFQYYTLKYMPNCTTSAVLNDMVTCNCNSGFNFLTVGYSLDAQSPAQIKKFFQSGGNQSISSLRMLQLIERSITQTMPQEQVNQFLRFAQQQASLNIINAQIQDQIIQICQKIALSKTITASNSQQALGLINQVVKQSQPRSVARARSFISLVQSLSLTAPQSYSDESFSITRYQFSQQRGLSIEIDSQDGNKVSLPDSIKQAYPQLAQIVIVRYKSKAFYLQATKTLYSEERYTAVTGAIQIKAFDANRNIISINQLSKPIDIQLNINNLDDSNLNTKRQCMAWIGQIRSNLTTQGCTSRSVSRKSVVCSCTHLTFFSVVFDSLGGEEQFPQEFEGLQQYGSGVIAVLVLIFISFLVGLIAECRDKWNIDETKVLSDKKRKWTDPFRWFCPCLLFRNQGNRRRAAPPKQAHEKQNNGKNNEKKSQVQYSSPKKGNRSPQKGRSRSPSPQRQQSGKRNSPASRFFNFQTQPITQDEARKVLYPYAKQPYKFKTFFKHSLLAANTIIGPFYGFDKFLSRVGKTSWLMIKITTLLAISLLLFTQLGADASHLFIYTIIISLFHVPYSFYDRCYLRRKPEQGKQNELAKREKKYTEQADLKDVIAQIPRFGERQVAAGVISETTRSNQPTTMRQMLDENRLHYNLQPERTQQQFKQSSSSNNINKTPTQTKGSRSSKRDEGFDGAFGDINWSPERKKQRRNIRQSQDSFKIRCSRFTIVALVLSILFMGSLCVIAVMLKDLRRTVVNGQSGQGIGIWIVINLVGLFLGVFGFGTLKILLGTFLMNKIGEKEKTKCSQAVKSLFVVRQIQEIYYEMEHEEKGQIARMQSEV